MRRWLVVLLLVVLPVGLHAQAFDKGFDFRMTDAYVSDAAPNTYVTNGDYYNYGSCGCWVSRNSVTFGWPGFSAVDARDRSTTVDHRLSGINFLVNTNSTAGFTVNLPASGTYDIVLALGDATGASYPQWRIKDGGAAGTLLATVGNGTSIASGSFMAANGTVYTAANWVTTGSTQKLSLTFATTVFYIEGVPPSAGGQVNALAHLRITSGGAAPAVQHNLLTCGAGMASLEQMPPNLLMPLSGIGALMSELRDPDGAIKTDKQDVATIGAVTAALNRGIVPPPSIYSQTCYESLALYFAHQKDGYNDFGPPGGAVRWLQYFLASDKNADGTVNWNDGSSKSVTADIQDLTAMLLGQGSIVVNGTITQAVLVNWLTDVARLIDAYNHS